MFSKLLTPIKELSWVNPTAEDVDDDNVRFDPYGSSKEGSPLVLAAFPGGFLKSSPNYNFLKIVRNGRIKYHF